MRNLLTKCVAGCLIATLTLLTISPVPAVEAGTLSKYQQRVADRIAKVAIENYDTYGILPSVAVVQAFVESSLGTHTPGNNNLWGINSGATSYSSIESGTIGYLKCVTNSQYYKGHRFKMDREYQLDRILAGGYCQPVGNYKNAAIKGWYRYNISKYDSRLKKYKEHQNKLAAEKRRKEKERKKRLAEERRQKKLAAEKQERVKSVADTEWMCIYSASVPSNAIKINPKYAKGGTILLYDADGLELKGIYDVITDESIGDERVIIGDEAMAWRPVMLELNEDAKG